MQIRSYWNNFWSFPFFALFRQVVRDLTVTSTFCFKWLSETCGHKWQLVTGMVGQRQLCYHNSTFCNFSKSQQPILKKQVLESSSADSSLWPRLALLKFESRLFRNSSWNWHPETSTSWTLYHHQGMGGVGHIPNIITNSSIEKNHKSYNYPNRRTKSIA